MGLKVVNFEKLFLHHFSTKIYQTLKDNVQGVFFNWPPPVRYRKENRPMSQPEAFLDEESHGRAAPIG